MNTEETYHFNQLKSAVIAKFLGKHSADSEVKKWNGEDIVMFQEDLFSEVKAKVSEKWFYTYFKNNPEKLPRIDMLNLLSDYAGHTNWNAFKEIHSVKKTSKQSRKYIWLIALIPLVIIYIATKNTENEFQFCFVDELSFNPITITQIDIKVLQKDQSPLFFKTDSLGCFNYKTKEKIVKFIVSSPYHKTDTVIRSIENNQNKVVTLDSDDYALILKYYTNGNVKDWSKHKKKIENIIHDNAQIYRYYNGNLGVEIYTKDEFVRLLTIPTSSLNKIKILDKSYKNDQILTLEFTVE